MLRQIFKFYPRRNFSNSAVWKDSKKEVISTPQQETQTNLSSLKVDFVPSEFDKYVLVYSGKYKSKDEIPQRICYSTLNTAKSRVRIKVSIYLMIGTLFMCGYYIWLGKKRAKAGDTILSRGIANQKKILEAKVKKEY